MMPLVLVALALLIVPLGVCTDRLRAQRAATRPRDGPGAAAVRRVAGRLRRRFSAGSGDAPEEEARDIDLYAACVAGGLNPAQAAAVVSRCGRASAREAWRGVACLLAMGVPPERAWRDAAPVPGMADLARLACHSHHSGARFAQAAAEIAERLREQGEDRATATAERAGVLIAAPLTLCFLPAFFLLGLAPVVIGVAREIM
ncbi:type II secretion system F family protein [Corynebacterium mastitidis]|uniref:Type II secretion system F family protein n=1 Tax=Corynebacterium mastitidis TaxID=161890 RepID=A0ABU8NVK8_9CORY